jgi:hypothetical protein
MGKQPGSNYGRRGWPAPLRTCSFAAP